MKPAPLAAGLLLLCAAAEGHQTLYEAIEVNLHDPAVIRVEFTIHAPELPTPLSKGLDPTAVDPGWLAGLTDPEIAGLTREAETFLRDHFTLRWAREEVLAESEAPENGNRLVAVPVRFEPAAAIRQPPPDTKLPPGCLLASVALVNPGPPTRLEVGYSDRGQKRLMLSISRPGAFPEVRDVPPGGRPLIELPTPPSPPPRKPRAAGWITGVILVLFVLGLLLSLRPLRSLLARGRRRGTCQ